jgi:protein phosphatase
LACVHGFTAGIANVGDSRAYLFRSHQLVRLTTDHAVADRLVRAGKISEDEARELPVRNMVSRYLGKEPFGEPDVHLVPLMAADRLLLCSDGLTGMVDDTRIADLLAGSAGPAEACQALVEAANAAGGRDNVTTGEPHVDGSQPRGDRRDRIDRPLHSREAGPLKGRA